MTVSQGQFGLFPERRHQRWSPLHRSQSASGEVTDLSERAGTEVADLMRLQITPKVFHRIEFWRIGRQERQLDVHVVTLDVPAHHFAFVRLQAVPDDEQRTRNLAIERRKKLDDLGTLDAAGKQAEVKLPEGNPRDRGELLPGEVVLQHRRLAAWCPGAYPRGTFGESRLVNKDYGLAAFFGVFLVPATAVASTPVWPARCAGRRVRSDAGS